MNDGQIGTQGFRWCATEKLWHGPLYDCEHYSTEVRQEVAKADSEFRSRTDPLSQFVTYIFGG